MRRIAIWLAATALLAGTSLAQEKSAVSAGAGVERTPAEKLEALIERFNKQQSETNAAYGEAKTEEEKDKVWAKRPGKEYVPEFRAIAEEARGTETAARAWVWTLRLLEDSDPKESQRIVELLLEEHMRSEHLGELTNRVRDPEMLRAMVAESPHERVRAGALFALGQVLLGKPSAEAQSEGRDCLEAVVAEYGELAYRNSTYSKAAEGYLYELDRLQIGMAAPDFETVDENGAKWRLSDYKGKVVVIDFWGFW